MPCRLKLRFPGIDVIEKAAWQLLWVFVLLGTADRPGAEVRFNSTRAWRDLERIVGFGPRPSGSPELGRTRRYIIQELHKVGVKTRVQSFTAQTTLGPVPMSNMIGEIPGKRSDVILIGGHYDTKYFPAFRFVGANDGGSSAALLIELARKLAGRSGEYTIWIVFFDGEEERSPDSNRGASYGSQYMVSEMAKSGEIKRLRAAVVFDMIGDRDLDILRDAGSTPWLTDILWRSARRLGYQTHFLDEAVLIEDDHVPFLRAGVPATLLIDYNYGSKLGQQGFWHTPEDTLDKLSPKSIQVVGEVMMESLRVIGAELKRLSPLRKRN